MTLQDVLIMGKQYGDARADWGRTRDERTRAATFLAIFEEAQEERRYSKLHDSDRGDSKTDEQGKCYSANASGNATVPMHQEKRCCMMMSQEICGSY